MIVISNQAFDNSKKVGNLFLKGNFIEKNKGFLVFKGEVYPKNPSTEELFQKAEKSFESLKSLEGEFFIIYYNSSKELKILGDKFARETLFYYFDGIKLIVSDDFWEIIKILKPNEENLDIQAVKEYAFFYGPLLSKTIIKNLFFFPPASILSYSKKLDIKQYWDFKYSQENSNAEVEAEKMDVIFDNAMKQIKANSRYSLLSKLS